MSEISDELNDDDREEEQEDKEEDTDDDLMDDVEEQAAELGLAAIDLAWLKALGNIVDERFTEPFPNIGVEIAYERMLIAAYERMTRIFHNDLPIDEI